MTTPPAAHIEWANRFKQLVPGDVTVTKHGDEDESHSIPIVTSRQAEGVVAATIGLMEFDQSMNPEVSVRSEVIMDARGDFPEIGNLLATVAFFIMKDGWKICPETVFEQLVTWYLPDTSLPHLYFTSPFQWGGTMNRVDLSDGPIYPLLAVPISEAEREMAENCGGASLESLWEETCADVLCWNRPSAA